jgi:hypothetical protein
MHPQQHLRQSNKPKLELYVGAILFPKEGETITVWKTEQRPDVVIPMPYFARAVLDDGTAVAYGGPPDVKIGIVVWLERPPTENEALFIVKQSKSGSSFYAHLIGKHKARALVAREIRRLYNVARMSAPTLTARQQAESLFTF